MSKVSELEIKIEHGIKRPYVESLDEKIQKAVRHMSEGDSFILPGNAFYQKALSAAKAMGGMLRGCKLDDNVSYRVWLVQAPKAINGSE
jgi:hypothetical protein